MAKNIVTQYRENIRQSDLKPNQRLVAWIYSEYATYETGTSARPSVDTVARETGLHPRTVRRVVHQLEGMGWLALAVEHTHRPNEYRLTIPSPDTRPPLEALDEGRGDTGPSLGVAHGQGRGDTRPPNQCITNVDTHVEEQAAPVATAPGPVDNPKGDTVTEVPLEPGIWKGKGEHRRHYPYSSLSLVNPRRTFECKGTEMFVESVLDTEGREIAWNKYIPRELVDAARAGGRVIEEAIA